MIDIDDDLLFWTINYGEGFVLIDLDLERSDS